MNLAFNSSTFNQTASLPGLEASEFVNTFAIPLRNIWRTPTNTVDEQTQIVHMETT